jgi:hypothetical protein
MFGQLLSNKNKIATVCRDTYYVEFGSKIWNLNEAHVTRCNGPRNEKTREMEAERPVLPRHDNINCRADG